MRISRSFLGTPAAALALVPLLTPDTAAQGYTIVDLGHLPSNPGGTYLVNDVNMARQAVGADGFGTTTANPLLYENGAATVLPLPAGYIAGGAVAINDAGQVVGWLVGDDGFSLFQVPGFWPNGAASPPVPLLSGAFAYDLNNAGVAVGDRFAGFLIFHAAMWPNPSTPIDLGTLSGGKSVAYGINAHNDVVGSSSRTGGGRVAVRWPAAGAPVALSTLAGSNWSEAHAVNDAGLIVGFSGDGRPSFAPDAAPPAQAVYWDGTGAIHTIGAVTGNQQSFAVDVNNQGQIVGKLLDSYPHATTQQAFFYSSDCGLIVLDSFLQPGSPFTSLIDATGINDRGDIVGNGLHADGSVHAFLMTRDGQGDPVGLVDAPCGGVFTTDLIAGQNQLAGSVCVANDGVNLCVEYKANPGWSICETHMDIELEYTDFPLSRNGNPKIGQFSYQSQHPGGVSSVTYCIPLAEFGYEPGDLLLIAAHAAMCNGETAWGAGIDFTGNNWATYFTYEMQSCCP